MMPTPPEPPAIHVSIEARPIDFMRLALCIEAKEQGSWDKDGGKACWTRLAWFETCTLSFSYAQSPSASRANQVLRLIWLAERLHAHFTPVNVYYLAVCWNKGFDAALADSRQLSRSYPYAEQVRNLYEDKSFHPDPLIP